MDTEPTSKKREIIAALSVLIVVFFIAGTVIATNKKTNSTTASSGGSGAISQSTTASTASYKDGQYMASGSYNSPGGVQTIGVSVTLKDNIVTATDTTSTTQDGVAAQYQNSFIAGYKKLVVGKNINSIKVSRVSGSSLTSQGFNNAIQQIKQQAAS